MSQLLDLLENGDAVEVFENVDHLLEIERILSAGEVDAGELHRALAQLSVHDAAACIGACESARQFLNEDGERLYLDCLASRWRELRDREGDSPAAAALDAQIMSLLHNPHSKLPPSSALVLLSHYEHDEGSIYVLEQLQASEILMEEYVRAKRARRAELARPTEKGIRAKASRSEREELAILKRAHVLGRPKRASTPRLRAKRVGS
jgi:hypothetical protein